MTIFYSGPHTITIMRFYSTSTAGLKYFVERTKVGKNLPIYTEYRNGGNTCYTLIKKISGDSRSLSNDLVEYLMSATKDDSNVVDKRSKESIKNKWKIREELGHVWVHGNQTAIVRSFLESRGF